MEASSPIVVVGAGITGAVIAFHLAARGARVTVLEQGLPASGATGASFAWIGRPVASPRPSAPLRALALDEYHRLEDELADFPVSWPGSLVWDHDDPDEHGEIQLVQNLSEWEPRLTLPSETAQWRPEDGSVDPVAATERLLHEAQRRGAEVRLGETVVELEHTGGTVRGVRTTTRTLMASTVVLACGVGAVALCRRIGFDLPVKASPTVLVRLDARPGAVRHILMSPEIELRQLPDGRLLAPVAYAGERSSADLVATAAAAEDRITALLRGPTGARADRLSSAGGRCRPTRNRSSAPFPGRTACTSRSCTRRSRSRRPRAG